ncbi:hypothetical protein [Burkholderia contaminans]|uniref:hypothetical protein n=1 Tax=Burkholderia contaminans TaxID=488447 RepID=UPI00310FB5FD
MVVLDLSPVVGSAASIPILGESASPIDFIGAEITIGAARRATRTQAPARTPHRARAGPRVISLRRRTASNP